MVNIARLGKLHEHTIETMLIPTRPFLWIWPMRPTLTHAIIACLLGKSIIRINPYHAKYAYIFLIDSPQISFQAIKITKNHLDSLSMKTETMPL